MRPVRVRPAVLALAAAALAGSAAVAPRPAAADLFEMKDGTKVDGKLVQEKDGFVWIRTLAETKKVAAGDVTKRTPGESAVDVLAAIRARVEKDPKDAAALWDLYLFLKKHAAEVKEFAKEAKSIPAKVVKLQPSHEEAHDALGEVEFEGRWVKKEDLARIQAEASRKAKQDEYSKRYGVLVEVFESEHWTLVDNTGCKDLPKKAKDMDEAYRLTAEILGMERFWDGQALAVAFKRYMDYERVLDETWKALKFPEWKYNAAKQRALGGYWLHLQTLLQMRCVPEQKTDAEDGMWAAFVHCTVHMCIWKNMMSISDPPPTWLEEGLASVVESEVRGVQKTYCVGIAGPRDTGGTTDKPKGGGKAKQGNDGLAGETQVFREHFKKALDDGEFPSLRKYLRMQLGEFGPAEVGGAIGLVTFLRGKDPEKFKELWKILRAGPGGKDDDPWKKVYGVTVIEDIEKEWHTWVRANW